jgi:hypothetical protein
MQFFSAAENINGLYNNAKSTAEDKKSKWWLVESDRLHFAF